MTKFRNYLGQLRLYSLVDLILMVLAFGFSNRETLGAICLWVSFLGLLEETHKHPGRLVAPPLVTSAFMLTGVLLLDSGGGYLFLFWSLLYCYKNRPRWGLVSPLIRGLQTASLLLTHATWAMITIASAATTIRNVLGDARDTSKDRAEGMLTWPVLLNWSDHKYLHLIAVMVTSTLWCVIGDLNPILLVEAWAIQLMTYWLTPR